MGRGRGRFGASSLRATRAGGAEILVSRPVPIEGYPLTRQGRA